MDKLVNLETNKIIAEFLDYKKGKGTDKHPFVYVNVPTWYKSTVTVSLEMLRFDMDWNLLNQAIEKIELLNNGKYVIQHDYDPREEFKGWSAVWFTLYPKDEILGMLDSLRFETKIEACYHAVIEYLKLH